MSLNVGEEDRIVVSVGRIGQGGALGLQTKAGGQDLRLDDRGIDPMKALYYSAVVNGVLAAPLMAAMMVIGSNPRIMGRLTLSLGLKIVGWAGTAVMAAAAVGLFLT